MGATSAHECAGVLCDELPTLSQWNTGDATTNQGRETRGYRLFYYEDYPTWRHAVTSEERGGARFSTQRQRYTHRQGNTMLDKLVKEHIILGVDPGTLFMGYALLHTIGSRVEILDFGVYDVHKLEDQYARLQKEFFFLQELIEKYHPTILAIESQFVDKNPQTMIKIVHAQGVAIAAALSKDVPVQEYSPMKVKMAITGNGHADKQQVADMLQRFLHIPDERMPKKLDATDALGIAYCHYLQLGLPLREKGAKNWTTFANQKGLVDRQLTTPNARLIAAMQTAKKKK